MFKVNNKVNTRIRKLTIKVNNKSGRRSALVVINFEIYPRGPIFGRKRIYGVAYIRCSLVFGISIELHIFGDWGWRIFEGGHVQGVYQKDIVVVPFFAGNN